MMAVRGFVRRRRERFGGIAAPAADGIILGGIDMTVEPVRRARALPSGVGRAVMMRRSR